MEFPRARLKLVDRRIRLADRRKPIAGIEQTQLQDSDENLVYCIQVYHQHPLYYGTNIKPSWNWLMLVEPRIKKSNQMLVAIGEFLSRVIINGILTWGREMLSKIWGNLMFFRFLNTLTTKPKIRSEASTSIFINCLYWYL